MIEDLFLCFDVGEILSFPHERELNEFQGLTAKDIE